jgi:type II secretory pathway component PulM
VALNREGMAAEITRLAALAVAQGDELVKLKREVQKLREAATLTVDGRPVPLSDALRAITEKQGLAVRRVDAQPERVEAVEVPVAPL